ncbi:cytosine permease [Escherichia coli]
MPKTQSQRTWKTFNYFTLWMGSVHNVPNYVMVGGFFILGLSTFSIMLAIILSAFFIAAVMVLNGAAGSKYGVPFAMILHILRRTWRTVSRIIKRRYCCHYVVWPAMLCGVTGLLDSDWQNLAGIFNSRW